MATKMRSSTPTLGVGLAALDSGAGLARAWSAESSVAGRGGTWQPPGTVVAPMTGQATAAG
jgi:hypothetical protein